MKKVLSFFVIWRIVLFTFVLLALSSLPLQMNYLGGGLSNYLKSPLLWAWSNFDGEHYIRIAHQGYGDLTYFFFPVYPQVVSYLSGFFADNIVSYVISGLLVSNLSFIVGLLGFVKLINIDYKKKVVFISLCLLLLFPTSFYFGSVYTESLFFALIIWSFYFARRRKWFLAGVLGAISTATRITGLALIPAYLIEIWLQKKQDGRYNLLSPMMGVLIIPLGILIYMFYLNNQVGDPLIFFHSLNQVFGEQRSTQLVMLPQVFYRYVFKILPSISYSYFPVVFTTWLEFVVALVFLLVSIIGFVELRKSYVVFLFFGYLIPTFSGSFSSLPRYVLVLFPFYILMAIYLSKRSKFLQILVYVFLFICLGIATALFTRGYWVS